jgi:uncharacterized paraquat-inducible protein A
MIKLQRCPACKAEMRYSDIDIAQPFECRTCGSRLAVSRSYWKTVRKVSVIPAAILCLPLMLISFYYILLFPLVLSFFIIVGFIFAKRFWPPTVFLSSELSSLS